MITLADVAQYNANWPTAIELARRHAPRCPICTHGARLWMIESLYAWRCRWGHVIHDEEVTV